MASQDETSSSLSQESDISTDTSSELDSGDSGGEGRDMGARLRNMDRIIFGSDTDSNDSASEDKGRDSDKESDEQKTRASDDGGKLFEVNSPMFFMEKITDLLKCPICLHNFTSPTFLDCHHTFCLPCLDELRNSQDHSCNEQLINCPTCRKTTFWTGKGMASLKPDLTMVALVDIVASTHPPTKAATEAATVTEGATEVVMVCSLCNNEASPTMLCCDCDKTMCHACWLSSDHIIHKIDVIKNMALKSCEKHVEYRYSFYCKTCHTLICAMCAATSHRGIEHEHQNIEETDDCSQHICHLSRDNITTTKSSEDQREAMVTQSADTITRRNIR